MGLASRRLPFAAAALGLLLSLPALWAGWVANRNILAAALFGVLALLTHDRWRRGQ